MWTDHFKCFWILRHDVICWLSAMPMQRIVPARCHWNIWVGHRKILIRDVNVGANKRITPDEFVIIDCEIVQDINWWPLDSCLLRKAHRWEISFDCPFVAAVSWKVTYLSALKNELPLPTVRGILPLISCFTTSTEDVNYNYGSWVQLAAHNS